MKEAGNAMHFRPLSISATIVTMSLTIHQIDVGGFDDNFSYLIANTHTKEAFVIDPSGDFLKVAAQVEAFNYTVVGILITHTHFDHIDKLDVALKEYAVPIYVHTKGVLELQKYGDVRAIEDSSVLTLGRENIKVIYTPGHIDDAVCFYIEAASTPNNTPLVITGDTLFVGGCGRTNELRVKDLYESLAELSALPEETVVFPGHDYGDTSTSTIGYEKAHNKYYLVGNFNEFKKIRLGV